MNSLTKQLQASLKLECVLYTKNQAWNSRHTNRITQHWPFLSYSALLTRTSIHKRRWRVACRHTFQLRNTKLRWTSMNFSMNDEDLFLSNSPLLSNYAKHFERIKWQSWPCLLKDWQWDKKISLRKTVHRFLPVIMSGTQIPHSQSGLFIYWEMTKDSAEFSRFDSKEIALYLTDKGPLNAFSAADKAKNSADLANPVAISCGHCFMTRLECVVMFPLLELQQPHVWTIDQTQMFDLTLSCLLVAVAWFLL